MKVDFIDQDHFVIQYLSEKCFHTEGEIKDLFKLLNYHLKHQYHYEFRGYYDVTIFCSQNLYVLEFENIDEYNNSDFNITMLLNSVFLYEFEDSDMFLGDKVFYNGKYYVEIIDMLDNPYLFEYGNIVYGKKIDDVLNQGILVSV